MTEEEARQKWCPMVRVADYTGSEGRAVTANRMTRVDDECNCIASDCMMWRWKTPDRQDGMCGLAASGYD